MTSANNTSISKQNDDERISIDLSMIIRGFVKFWWLSLILMLLFGGAMFAKDRLSYTPMYETSVTFSVRTQEPGSAGIGLSSYSFSYARATANQLSSTFPAIIESRILQDIIISDMELEYFPATLSASVVKGTNMFTITAKGKDPQLIYDVLLSVIENYPAVAQYVIGNTELVILNPPEVPSVPYNSFSYRSSVIKGALAGLALSVLWMIFYSISRDTIRNRREIRKKLNRHCVGTLPTVSFKKYKTEKDLSVLLTNTRVSDSYREAFRALRNSIISSKDVGKVIMLTSTAPGEGKTTVSVNLAVAIARTGRSVIVVDADTKNPSVNKLIGMDMYAPDKDDTRPGEIQECGELGISVMNFNTAAFTAWELFDVDNMRELFSKLSQIYDYVIVDTPPAGLTSEPSVIAQTVDSIIMVVRQDTVRVSRILEALDSIHYQGSANIVGCILNAVSEGLGEYGYGYRYSHYKYGKYGYGKYGYGEKRREKAQDNENIAHDDETSEAESE